MLHLKLPKGKVAAACEHAGQYHNRLAEAERMAYRRDLETWRKTRSLYTTEWPPIFSPAAKAEAIRAKKLIDMADACTFSTGDVYVSVELWDQIKGYYDV